VIPVHDFGAGSALRNQNDIEVSGIARKSLSPKKFGRLLFRLADFYRARQIIELGSSLGISTGYLASADTGSHVTTLEGSPAVSDIASETFDKLGLDNVSLVTGKFEDKLEQILVNNPKADLVFLDGNHRKKPVLDYFEQILKHMAVSSLIIIHDIHWSREMEEAWAIIQKHPSVKMTIDIFSAGLVFFREEFHVRQHFKIRF
jgi:predicted O-methyltransferase YrrM